MYRQVLVHRDDCKLQRILFRFSKDEPIQEFELNTVTYGQACAPYLAIKCLRRLATLEEKNYPLAAAAVHQGSYVDDFQTGVDSEEEAIELIQQMNKMMELGGFELHKFSSNSKEVIESVPINKRETKTEFIIDSNETIKTLGLQWQPSSDKFHFSACEIQESLTKRSILSVIARIYDPLGLLGPIVIAAKMIMQETWKLYLNWDDMVPDDLRTKWINYLNDLSNIDLIQGLVPAQHWYHIKGECNPVDIVSRGSTAANLMNNNLWWNRPDCLQAESPGLTQEINPEELENIQIEIEQEERKSTKVHTVSEVPTNIVSQLLAKYSSLTKLKTILAHCLRFINNCRLKASKKETASNLTTAELQGALEIFIKSVQKTHFEKDIKVLEKGEELKLSSKNVSLSPFIDKSGILRVGGRLSETDWQFSRKHPILLPTKDKLTKLIFEEEHMRNLHAGPQELLSTIRTRYWPINGRSIARQVVHKCIRCFRNNPTSMNQIMGQLPKERVQLCRPFFRTGVDFGGPIITLVNKGRGRKTQKSYIALFICFATKAIHLEAVSDLTSDAFIVALRRFVARIGIPQKLFSDNATNFTGSDRELKEIYDFLRNEKKLATDKLFKEGIQWSFIPPGSSHMGGLWEAGIKSCKYHLKRVMGSTLLTFEEFYTVLTQIESCLNSRQLCPLSSSPLDFEALTPGHFLIGESLTEIPDVDLLDVPINRLNRWHLCQSLHQNFWNQWSVEYVSSMQAKPTWTTPGTEVAINDLVLIRDENIPPMKWKLGRVVQLHPGQDSVTRVVTIKTQNVHLMRAISKLCKLPTNCD